MQKRIAKTPEQWGIVLKIGSGICFAAMFAIIKWLGGTVPLGEVVFFRSFFAMIPLVAFLLITSDFPAGLKTRYPGKHLVRCVLGTLAMFFAFATLRYLPIAEATAISYLSPVILVILAALFLKEAVNRKRLLGVGLGLLGLALMTLPNFSATADSQTLIGVGLALMSAILIAAALLQVRQLSKMGENAAAIAFYFALTSTAMGIVTIFAGWSMPSLSEWMLLISTGLLGGVAQILMTLAFKYAEASAMAPYDYLSIVWAVLIGIVFFGEIPGAFFWLAMPVILLGAYVARPKEG